MKAQFLLLFTLLAISTYAKDSREGYVYKYGPHQVIRLDTIKLIRIKNNKKVCIFEDLLWVDWLNFHPVLMKYLQTETYRGEPITNFVQAVF